MEDVILRILLLVFFGATQVLASGCGGGWYVCYGYYCCDCAPGYSCDGWNYYLCSPGHYQDSYYGSHCEDCWAGTHNPNDGGTSSDCTACPAYQYSEAGWGNCVDCPAGTRWTGSAAGYAVSCATCPAGTSSPARSLTCNPCPVAKYAEAQSGSCTSCPMGRYWSGSAGGLTTACPQCAAGTYSGALESLTCTPCNPGQYSAIGSPSCTNCPAGKMYTGIAGNLATACVDCPAGWCSTAPASLSCTQCIAGTSAPAGSSSCPNCLAGQYSGAGAGSCSACPAGQFSSIPGSASCSTCLAGSSSVAGSSVCTTCSAGKFAAAGDPICGTCSAGYYSTAGSEFCTICPAGTSSAASSGSCTNCPAGKSSPAGSSTCTDCFAGEYSNSGGLCTPCPAGQFSSLPGTPSCSTCGVGKYSLLGATACTDCDPGTMSTTIGASDSSYCLDCPTGKYSGAGASSCIDCPGGKYNPNLRQSICQNCPRDTYNPSPGMSLRIDCIDCNPGQWSPEGSTVCSSCFPLCKSCNSNSQFDCNSCLTLPHVYQNGLKCLCEDDFYYNATTGPINHCQQCHEFCTLCSTSKTTCQACINHPRIIWTGGDKCECKIGNGYFLYVNESNMQECTTCFPLCSDCYGPKFTQCTTCDPLKKGTYKSPDSCICTNHLYYEPNVLDCASCNSLCANCFGPSNLECEGCAATAYSVEDHSTWCVDKCFEIGPYFPQGKVCKNCHSDCESCFGPTDHECTLCINTYKFQHKGSCVSTCPTYFIGIDRICLPCYFTCKTCSNTTSLGCTSCIPGYFYYNGRCEKLCPKKTFENIDECTNCVEPCEECTSYTKCITCAKGFYLDPFIKTCGPTCPTYTFADDSTRTCIICHFTCFTCKGPYKQDCILCNFARGFARSSGAVGECYSLVCVNGDFMLIDEVVKMAKCDHCDKTCTTCNGPTRDDCITCRKDLIPSTSIRGLSNARCVACTEMGPGLRNPVGTETGCQGICGDGMRRANEECDDGNTDDKDGCSSECKVEEGFRCEFSNLMQVDVCINILPLNAALQSVSSYNAITITFSKLSRSEFNKSYLAEMMNVTLENADQSCIFNWSLNVTYENGGFFNKIVIPTKIKCSIKGDAEQVRIIFPRDPPIKDAYNNTLRNPELVARLKRKPYISDGEAAVMSSGGAGFSISTFVTFGISIIPALLQSVAIGQFWAFVNMIQILSYIPTMNILLPKNFEILLTQYLTISQISIPFNMLPDWIPNPKKVVVDFLTAPLTDSFTMCGLSSLSFIYNFADQLFTWILIGAMYFTLSFLNWLRPKKRFVFIKTMKKEYEYNIIIRILLETYLHMCVCSLVNIYGKMAPTIASKISFGSASIALTLALAFLVISLRIVERKGKELRSKGFKSRYGTITEGIRTKASSFVRGYNSIYLIRRLVYAILLVILNNAPEIQLSLCIFVVVIPMLLYLVFCRPFATYSDNLLNLVNEVILFAVFLILFILQTCKVSNTNASYVGWFMTSLVLTSLLATWLILFPTVFHAIANLVKDAIKFMLAKQTPAPTPTTNPKATSEIELQAKEVKPENEVKNSMGTADQMKIEQEEQKATTEDLKQSHEQNDISLKTPNIDNLKRPVREQEELKNSLAFIEMKDMKVPNTKKIEKSKNLAMEYNTSRVPRSNNIAMPKQYKNFPKNEISSSSIRIEYINQTRKPGIKPLQNMSPAKNVSVSVLKQEAVTKDGEKKKIKTIIVRPEM